ncbi:MAG: phosphoribosylformylglycinamidine synthase [Hydrogenoanaerobacterium sp.]
MAVYRVYTEKKKEFAVEARALLADIRTVLGLESITGLRVLNRYDVENISPQQLEAAKPIVFSEPPIDFIYNSLPQLEQPYSVFAVQYLPGQFDQRADSCSQCIQIMTQGERPLVKTARVYILEGKLTQDELAKIKAFVINPVESREASMAEEETLVSTAEAPASVQILDGFTELDKNGLNTFINEHGLAMDLDDITLLQAYFKNDEKREPSITEIRMIDTYWSDHCRHTTFSTNLDSIDIEPDYIKKSCEKYYDCRKTIYAGKNKAVTLMDLAVIGAKELKREGLLKELDESDEINACSVKIDVDVDGKTQPWLLMFKNETHNHPTEIEPFGGAATCLGGAIRDPLSGRSYVYQAMRVTGGADPTVPISKTMAGKLPQRKLTTTAAAGYSSYGNQIGLATGQVSELYHPGYAAKRMELGAVLGAAPACNVRRECPNAGDIVLLLGGKTGRDGCGGATGSSKKHTLSSLETCGAEVQKGNAPEERKIQRLFRNPNATRLIKRCNDFGAGGVSVAVGELADGLIINLDAVPKKYDGLDGTELAISESQERMAVVVDAKDAAEFIKLAQGENLAAVEVALVTEAPRLVMNKNGKKIVDVSRAFLNTNGAVKHADVKISGVNTPSFTTADASGDTAAQRFASTVLDLNVVSRRGLEQRFDSTIGAGTVNMPYGGKWQLTPTQAMAAKLPLISGETTVCSLMSWGFNPFLSQQSPYHGAIYAVTESIAKLVAAGGSRHKCWLSFQEYFGRTGNDPTRWGAPFAALLGAFEAQLQLSCAAIGGKDSMSGSFEGMDVPPTLVSFAVSTARLDNIISPEFKKAGSNIYYIAPEYDKNGLPDFESVKKIFDKTEALIADKKLISVWAVGFGGVAEGVFKMCLGNKLGAQISMTDKRLCECRYGAFVAEAACELPYELIGKTTAEYEITVGKEAVDLVSLTQKWQQKLEPIFPCTAVPTPKIMPPTYSYKCTERKAPAIKVATPRVLIPVFPGTNCEYDTARAFAKAGAEPEVFIIRNLSSAAIEESVLEFTKAIVRSNIIAIPGGFSGGDEPDGSGKFITAFFRSPHIAEAVQKLLDERDGLMCGICNGFQALIKLGLVPYGKITQPTADSPTLTYNIIGRHQSLLVNTRVAGNKSPWLMYCNVGDIHTTAISHGEGRFVASSELIEQLAANGQIATQYVDLSGAPSLDIRFNPNGSACAIEGITSPDGRIFGKMAHSERITNGIYKNVPGNKENLMFKGAVDYFK